MLTAADALMGLGKGRTPYISQSDWGADGDPKVGCPVTKAEGGPRGSSEKVVGSAIREVGDNA